MSVCLFVQMVSVTPLTHVCAVNFVLEVFAAGTHWDS